MITPKYREYMRDAERDFLECELEASGWNVTVTAHDLGMPLSTLKYRIRALGLSRHAALADRPSAEDV